MLFDDSAVLRQIVPKISCINTVYFIVFALAFVGKNPITSTPRKINTDRAAISKRALFCSQIWIENIKPVEENTNDNIFNKIVAFVSTNIVRIIIVTTKAAPRTTKPVSVINT